MKFTTVFAAAATLAVSAIAEPVRIPQAHPVRDIAAVESAASSVTAAIKSLTKSVTEFNGDSIQVEADAAALAAAIELGTEGVASSGDIDITGLVGLQSCITRLTTAGTELVQKLVVKKSQFEQAGLCGTVEKLMTEIGDKSKDMIKTVSSALPEQFQGVVAEVGGKVTEVLLEGATAYTAGNCVSNPAANTSKSLVPYPTGTLTFSVIPGPTTKTSTMKVTVTSCPEGGNTQTSISIIKPTTSFTPGVVPSYVETLIVPPVASTTQLITAPQPTITPKPSVIVPTASQPALPVSSIPVAAGPRNAVGGAGIFVAGAIVAAMIL